MTIRPFETLDRLRQRIAEALIAQSGLRQPALTAHLRQTLTSSTGDGHLIPPPVLEGAFPFTAGTETLGELSGKLLNSRLVDALVGDGTGSGYSFPSERYPYRHQLDAWRILGEVKPKSVVVSAGTGSGKTECFLVPMLDSLYRRNERIDGVEAIMLYPLNALIASQQERLDAWTKPSKGSIRYCLYNGILPEKLATHEQRAKLTNAPQLVPDRQSLRAAPPPLLVTNLTMLEYMLVRPQDRPIIQASKGRLKWIVLDEAHTLVGSAAAEVALLLRRVMEAFEVDPATVRFVATSATIGEGPAVIEQLRCFLADIGGIDISQVEVVTGERCLPKRKGSSGSAPTATELRDLPPAVLYDRLAAHDPIWKLVQTLKDQTVSTETLDRLGKNMGVDGETLAMSLARAKSLEGETLAPLRVHSFHRSVPGLWCCTNPQCADAIGENWSAGKILFEREESCPTCCMPVAELYSCNECGEAFMMAEEKGDRLTPPRNVPPNDEFLFDAERVANEDEEGDEQLTIDLDTPSLSHCFSLSNAGLLPLFVDTATGRTADGSGEGRYHLTAHAGGGKGPCPACNANSKSGDKLYPFRFGAPFVIGNAAPMLLSAMPQAEGIVVPSLPQMVPDLPSSGRQLISFTDSRQGTARMAAKLQVESERAFVRSFVYQAVQHKAAGTGESEETAKLRENIKALKSIPGWEDGTLAEMVRDLEMKLSALTGNGGSSLEWNVLKSELADRIEVREWLPEVWGDRADLFRKSTASAASQLAEALMLREMMRRPKLANSPETMGIARLVYPAIEKSANAPSSFLQKGANLNDWKAWLTSLLTFSIRGNLAVHVNHDVLQWIMRKGFPKGIIAPGLEPGRRQQRWPSANPGGNQTQVIELLRLGLGLNPGSQSDRSEMQDWLEKAWSQLGSLFTQNASGERALDFGKLEIGGIENAYLCPVTRRIVDVAPFGLSPYARTKLDVAEPLIMPRYPANGDNEARRAFVEEDEIVASLRLRGLWTDMHDRIALFSPYARSAEHSAQLSPTRLRNYEAEFKAGRINLLNCSTTMEMGVDIGSVNGVMMTNVPPSIANYRQRVGRAGRRGQPLSLAFTFAKDRPLDREAFRNPEQFLKRSIAAPRVALDSLPIVQRHVNAYFLSEFLKIHSGNLLSMKAGDFFGCPESSRANRVPKGERPVSQFIHWLEKATTGIEHQDAIHRLVRGSIVAARTDLINLSAEVLAAVETDFVNEWIALQDQVLDAEAIGATSAVEAHLKRLCREFLLSDLADRGFLPGHGFPNHVVSFELDRKDISEGSEDQRGRRHGGPKRPLDIAIRDYAPGAETVVDGQVYRVGGVTLNWHRPSSDDGIREIQALRWAARCTHCGDSWTGAGSWSDVCRTCGDASIVIENYLKPAGFLRDRHVDVHAEVDRVSYVRPEPARVSAGSAPWEALSKPTVGRLRVNRRGTVYYHTKGPEGAGYGLCLRCGRMEPMQDGETMCTGLSGHKPLRSRESFTQPCQGNAETFAIRPSLHLGHEVYTDVLELQPAATPDIASANAIGIAIREAIARHLGIEADEIGYGIGPSRNAMANSTMSIFLHDRAAGGAGYVARAAEEMRSILKSALSILHCPRDCAHACSSCVLVSDAPEREEELDRRKAIAFMDAHLTLPDSIAPEDKFAPACDISDRPLPEIDDWLHGHRESSLTVWTRAADIIELRNWSPTFLFQRWASNGRRITVVIPTGTIGGLDASQILFLRDYCSRNGITLAEGNPIRFENGSILFALAAGEHVSEAWASRDESILNAGPEWGAVHTLPIARGLVSINPPFADVAHEKLRPAAGAAVVMLDASFDGPVSRFSERMSKAIRKAASDCGISDGDAIAKVVYRDRYARSPIVVKLLTDTVASLSPDRVAVLTIETSPDRAGNFSRSHIASDIEADSALIEMAEAYGNRCNVDISLVVGQLPHKRSMTLEFNSGASAIVDLDQGFGWLIYEGNDRYFDAKGSAAENARRLQKLSGVVRRRHDHDSQMVVWRRK